MITKHIEPTMLSISHIHEQIHCKKYPDFNMLIEKSDQITINQEYIAFQNFCSILTDYQINSVLFFKTEYEKRNGYDFNFYKVNDDKNTSDIQSLTYDFFIKALVTAAYFQQSFDNKVELFQNIPTELKNKYNFMENEKSFKDAVSSFWKTPFIIIKED